MRAHSFSLEDGIIYLNGIPLKQNEVFGFLESGRMQMDNQEKEIAELKQLFEDLEESVQESLGACQTSDPRLGQVATGVLKIVLGKMEELSKEKK